MAKLEYNIYYESPNGTYTYLGQWVSNRKEAEYWLRYFRNKYIGKQYPNKKGFYPYSNARIIFRTPR